MAKGRDKHQERLQALSLFGKDLARRASSKCELCEAAGVKLQTVEVAPVPKQPDFDHCLLACDDCREQLLIAEKSPKRIDSNHWRCLNTAVWSELPMVQVSAVLLLKQIANSGEDWAADLLEQCYLTPEVEDWILAAQTEKKKK